MELDTHCLKILGQLQAGEISEWEAKKEMDKHGDGLLYDILKNGFTATSSAEDVKNWRGSVSVA